MTALPMDEVFFFKDSIELLGGSVEAFVAMNFSGENDISEAIENYYNHLIYQIKWTLYSQHHGFAEAVSRENSQQVGCVVSDTKHPGGFCVISYYQGIPTSDHRCASLDDAYTELIDLGYTLPMQGALSAHLSI